VPCTAEPGHLLAVSNHFGWVVAASSQGGQFAILSLALETTLDALLIPRVYAAGFGLFSLPTLRSTARSASPHDTPKVDPALHVPTPSPVDFLRFAMGEKLVVAGLRDGSVAVWRLKSLVEGQVRSRSLFGSLAPATDVATLDGRETSPEHLLQSAPLKTLPALVAGESLIDLCPNPAPDSPLLAVLAPSAAAPLTIFNLETSAVHATFPSDLAATSACWSVKGKQLAVGTASGTIVQLSPEGEQKALVPAPADLSPSGAFEVRSVEWLENNVFLATYAKPRTKSEDDVEHEDEVYVITKAGQEMSYTKFADPCPPFGMMGRQGRRWVGRFRNW
jgi:nucleoporin NUP159